jgi:hypothetical protein
MIGGSGENRCRFSPDFSPDKEAGRGCALPAGKLIIRSCRRITGPEGVPNLRLRLALAGLGSRRAWTPSLTNEDRWNRFPGVARLLSQIKFSAG